MEFKECGIHRFNPSNYINATGFDTATRHGKILKNFYLVGEAVLVEDQLSCLEACKLNDQCQSCTFYNENTANPMICVLNYGPTERKKGLGQNSGISSAPKDCDAF